MSRLADFPMDMVRAAARGARTKDNTARRRQIERYGPAQNDT
jgi:hypothetical protein